MKIEEKIFEMVNLLNVVDLLNEKYCLKQLKKLSREFIQERVQPLLMKIKSFEQVFSDIANELTNKITPATLNDFKDKNDKIEILLSERNKVELKLKIQDPKSTEYQCSQKNYEVLVKKFELIISELNGSKNKLNEKLDIAKKILAHFKIIKSDIIDIKKKIAAFSLFEKVIGGIYRIILIMSIYPIFLSSVWFDEKITILDEVLLILFTKDLHIFSLIFVFLVQLFVIEKLLKNVQRYIYIKLFKYKAKKLNEFVRVILNYDKQLDEYAKNAELVNDINHLLASK